MYTTAETEPTTEEKIRRAAIAVFTQKGYAGTKTRDIAKTAGINIATLHYYHRTKDKLFDLVAQESMTEFMSIHKEIFILDLDLKKKIYLFVERYTEMFRAQPYLAMFCLAETERNPQAFQQYVDFGQSSEVMEEQLTRLIKRGEIRAISTQNFINALVGMTIYPFLTRGTITKVAGLSDEDFCRMLEEQKVMIPKMIIGYLYTEGQPCGKAAGVGD